MKAKKPAFIIMAIIILLMTYVAMFGVDIPIGNSHFFIPGSPNMRFGIDIRGGVDAVFEPTDNYNPTDDELEAARATIENRLDGLNILDREVTVDQANDYIIVRFPWKSGETSFDPEKAIAELGETAKLTFVDPDGNVVVDGSHVTKSIPQYDQESSQYVVHCPLMMRAKSSLPTPPQGL
jgi:preprotein translocase subunit SecD